MSRPTVEDAVELITSRTYAAMGSTTATDVEMKAGEIVAALRALGAEDDVSARVLVTEAAQRYGGRTEIEHRQGGLRAGGPRIYSQFRLWMPASALDEE